MNLISVNFILFAVLTIAIYFVIPKKYRWIVLLAFSVYFYHSAGIMAFCILVAEAVFVFATGILLERIPVESKKRKLVLALSIFLIVGYLMLAKVFVANSLNHPLILMPLGISYVSFSLIGYLVEIYWEKSKAERNIFRFLLFALFFPKISQGPIEKYSDLAPQLYEGGAYSYERICFGMQRMIYGYFKKVVIADRIALFTEPVFSNVSEYAGSVIILATALGSMQLYCDFSGYMDIVLGFTEILGIRMAENFKHPFFSKSAAEFWRRWHITLGTWFKDYVYTPVVMSSGVKKLGKWGRKNVGKRFGNCLRKVIPLSAVWILTGLWHGTGISYILWGVYWGIIIIFSTIFEEEIIKLTKILKINTEAPLWKLFQMIRTFCIFSFGILMTRVSSIHALGSAIYNIIHQFSLSSLLDESIYSLGLDKVNFGIVWVCLLVVLIISIMQEKQSVRQYIASMKAPVRWLIYAISVSVVLFIGIYGSAYSTQGFEYTNF